jgi:hypothetical protein
MPLQTRTPGIGNSDNVDPGHRFERFGDEHDLDYYLQERRVFDTAGVCGAITSVSSSLAELNPARIVLGTDYPQEIRTRKDAKAFVSDLRNLGPDGERILSQNSGLLLR